MAATILVVDDEAPIRELVTELLEGDGYRVLQARNGRDALDVLARETPQLVLSDVMMPIMDGIELLRAMKAKPELAAIPVILITAAAHDRAMRAGADAVLDKPFNLDQLEALVRRWLPRSSSDTAAARP